jgi:hypothetical protein
MTQLVELTEWLIWRGCDLVERPVAASEQAKLNAL